MRNMQYRTHGTRPVFFLFWVHFLSRTPPSIRGRLFNERYTPKRAYHVARERYAVHPVRLCASVRTWGRLGMRLSAQSDHRWSGPVLGACFESVCVRERSGVRVRTRLGHKSDRFTVYSCIRGYQESTIPIICDAMCSEY